MRRMLAVSLLCLAATHVIRAQQALTITRVLLYKNGMAYIVRSGQLTAPASLTFHPGDMNDVLKSFTAWNPDTGALYSVGYTAGIPSSHMLSRYPFDITNPGTGLGGFLLQVKGADLRLDSGGRRLEGKLVAVQEAPRTTAPQTSSPDYRMTLLLRDDTLQTMWLSDVRSVEFVDPQLREQLRSYLEVLAAGRQDVTREVSVYPVPAPGPIQVAYLQQFPLWKTSYRVDLGSAQTRIQGWAQIDNPTGEAWDNVSVSLLSGAPVSFVMDLYDPLYTNRVTVAVPGGQVAAPRQYESAVSGTVDSLTATARLDLPGAKQVNQGQGGRGGGAGNGFAAGAAGGSAGRVISPSAAPAPPRLEVRAPIMAESFEAANAARVEDLYEYTFPFPVRIASRQSALLPFLQKTLNVERLSIFNASADRGNPRLGARVENTTEIPFEAGPVTFFADGRYAGEAVMDYLPRREKALISYGVDYEIQIAGKQQSRPETMARLTIAKGIATLFMESSLTTTYEIRNKGPESKTLVIEHPRIAGRSLQGVEAFETTDGFYRFRVALAPGEATTLAVPELLSRRTDVSLTSLTRPQLLLFAGARTPQAVRDRLGRIVELQEQIAALTTDVKSTEATVETLFHDQERLRENLKALGNRAGEQQLRTRYLNQLRRQEDDIDAARAQIDAINKRIAATQGELGEMIAQFTVNG